ncbi:hypothetical protein G7Y89_g7900 [Cudoniella acicularis]|uniref:Uncharacterized protein n=1 Tax=Cudoniella acicularis TaxID=354080 RepID=A0A8H4W1J0_9HELO|nr:hypothetical protein G7Y89_g7900 [Cudoniella acicularis]
MYELFKSRNVPESWEGPLHLWGQDQDTEWLKSHVTSLYEPKELLRISSISFCDQPGEDNPYYLAKQKWDYNRAGGEDPKIRWEAPNPLELEVQAFKPKPNGEYQHFPGRDTSNSTFAIPSVAASTDLYFYVIAENSLPSLDSLEAWALHTTKLHKCALVGGFQGDFLSLARRYCECKKELPMKDFVWKAVRLSCLYGIRRSGLPQLRKSRKEPRRYASIAVQRQIDLIVSKGMAYLEAATLPQLQKAIFDPKVQEKETCFLPRHRMGNVKFEVRYRSDKNFQGPEDALLRSLILDCETKFLKPNSDPLAKKYYESSKLYYELRREI